MLKEDMPHVEGGFLLSRNVSSAVVAAVFISLWRLSALARLSVDVADVCSQPYLLRRGAFLIWKEE